MNVLKTREPVVFLVFCIMDYTYLFVVIIDIDIFHLSQLCCKALWLIVTLPLEKVV